MQLKFEEFKTFVARHIDQETKYPLLQVNNISVEQDGANILLCHLSVERIKVTLNENYVLFFTQIADHHLAHILAFA